MRLECLDLLVRYFRTTNSTTPKLKNAATPKLLNFLTKNNTL
jgi:hypothetical protein